MKLQIFSDFILVQNCKMYFFSLLALNKKENREFAKEILCWILLTDQWPFRLSYILEIIEDADQRKQSGKYGEAIPDDASLLEIYEG